jgi:tetratricopeptide (TPR) repeat protein
VSDDADIVSQKAVAAAAEAKALLKRVVIEHQGTQWAIMAQREIETPFGFRWVETHVNPVARKIQPNGRSESTSPWYFQKNQLNLATRLAKQGYLAKAREELDRVGDLTPATADASAVMIQRGELFAFLGVWDRAAADYGESVRLRPEDYFSRSRQILALLAAGEREAALQAGIDLLDRFRKTTVPADADLAASSLSVLALSDAASQGASVRLAKFAQDHILFRLYRNVLGSALYRAGRFEDAIRELEESRKARIGSEDPIDCLFLAMANQRLSHRDQAHRWLKMLRNRQPSADPNKCWAELEIRLLRSEAEALILYDPGFPLDPFAP